MRRLLLSFILILALAVPTSAHPGDTDSSGGHTDHSTGEYHYHHGYSAHNHYDMDGDGDRDCPYDFDDQTGANSGTSTGSSSYSSSSRSATSTDYQRGYDDGHDDGYAEGKKYVTLTADRRYEEGLEKGLEEGRSAGYADGYAAGYSKARTLAFWAAGLVGAFFLLIGSHRRGKRRAEDQEREARYERALDELRDERDNLISEKDQLKAEHKLELQQHLYNHELNLQKVVAQTDLLCRIHADDPTAKLKLGIPKEIHFNGSDIYIGTPSGDHPNGSLTVFTSYSGTRYHFECGCSGSYTPNLIFDVIGNREPCKRCAAGRDTPDYIPGWYSEYRQLLANQRRIKMNRPVPPKRLPTLSKKPDALVSTQPRRERLSDIYAPTWESVSDGMEHTQFSDKYIAVEDLEYAALSMGVDIDTALLILNEDRKQNGFPPFILKDV